MSARNGTQVFSQEQPVPLTAEPPPSPAALDFLSAIALLGPPSERVTASFSFLDSDPSYFTTNTQAYTRAGELFSFRKVPESSPQACVSVIPSEVWQFPPLEEKLSML